MIYLAVPYSRDPQFAQDNYRELVTLLRKYFPDELFISTVDIFPFQADESFRDNIMDLATTIISSNECKELWYGGLTTGVVLEKDVARVCHKKIQSLKDILNYLSLIAAEEEHYIINQMRGFL